MRRKIVYVLFIALIIAVASTALFSCKRVVGSGAGGRVTPVSTAMNSVCDAIVAADGSGSSNLFTMVLEGSLSSGDALYDFAFNGAFDVSENNRANDMNTVLSFEVKQGGIEKLALYYKEGKTYLHFPPYARYAEISDFNVAEIAYDVRAEKKANGTIDRAIGLLPSIASRICGGCRCFSENGLDGYRFFLSYEQLFSSISSLVEQADIGIMPADLSALLGFDSATIEELLKSEPETSITFYVSSGVLVSATAEKEGSGAIKISRFSLKSGAEEIALPDSISSFRAFDPRNFSLSGKATLSSDELGGDSAVNYGVVLGRESGAASYEFDYDIKTNYVAGQGTEFSVSLSDPNGRVSYLHLRGGVLYADLTAYGIGKFKVSADYLSAKLGAAGFKDTGSYEFKDKLRLLTLLAAGRKTDGDKVSCSLGKDFFDEFAKKIGIQGIFGVEGASFSFDTRNNRLQDLNASVTVASLTFSLSAPDFTFGSPVELAPVSVDEYADLETRTSIRVKTSGTMLEQTGFASSGEFLSALFSSIGGEEVRLSAEGVMSYSSDIAYSPSGELTRAFIQWYASSGEEIVKAYYTSETTDRFYLIYPEDAGVRPVRELTLAEEPFAAFNSQGGIALSVSANKVFYKASDDAFTFEMNNGFIAFIKERLKEVYPDLKMSWTDLMAFRRVGFRFSDDAIRGTIVYNSDNEFYVNAATFDVSFNEEFSLLSLSAAAPEKVALLAENDMPVFADAVFTGDLKYKLSTLVFGTGNKIWRYEGTPKALRAAGEETTVTAEASLLGKTISRSVKVDLSPAETVSLTGGAEHSSKFDVGEKKFTFSYYNDLSPTVVLSAFDKIIVDTDKGAFVKSITWNTSGVTTADDPSAASAEPKTERSFTVKPLVKTYFGDEIHIGPAAEFTLTIVGAKAVSTDYSLTFVAYDGRDPLNAAVYSDVLNVRTADGKTLTAEKVAWDLTNPSLEEKKASGALYRYKTNPEAPDKMKAKVYDLMGNYTVIEVPIYFVPKVVGDTSFDLSGLDGVTYDAEHRRFDYDVLKVRTFTSSQAEKILPTSLVANPGSSDEFAVSGIKWEFETLSGVVNSAGATGALTLIIGDSLSGYQVKRFEYAFSPIEITAVELLGENGESIEKKTQDMFSYEFTSLNAYTYVHPVSLKVTFKSGDKTESEIIPAGWSFDKPFNEERLCEGGTYNGTGYAGSEKITLKLEFDQALITGYTFSGSELEIRGKTLSFEEHQGKNCLTFAVLAALDPDQGLDYTSAADYPSEMKAFFNNGSEPTSVNVSWDISAFGGKSDIIGNGFYGQVSAVAKGQVIPVYVYVAPAIGDHDEVYTKSDKSSKNVSFRLMTPSENGFTVTDPRDAKNYPDKLFVESGLTSSFYPVNVVSWDLGDSLVKMYTKGLASGANANEISGNASVTARIGNDKVGHKDILIEVAVIESPIRNITVSGVPFAASSELTGGASLSAIEVDYTPGAHGSVFAYEMSIGVNPYYVVPTSPESYPKYIDFFLNGVPVKAKASWDLSAIPSDAALTGNTKIYPGEEKASGFPTYAMIDLGGAFPNVTIGVEVNVIRRAIDKVWINGSNQPYIDIDGYAAEPFGNNVSGELVTMDVLVQFKGDSRKYPLKLKYDKSGVVLSYDGSAVKTEVAVNVGNENGGYQTIEGYSVRVFSNIVSAITLSSADRLEGTDGKFFETSYESPGSEVLVYTYKHVMDMGKELPSSLSIEFGMGAGEKTVFAYDPDAAQRGVVFSWVRNEENHIGIELWNASVSADIAGARQRIFNYTQSDYNAPSYSMFFGSDTWTEVFRDSTDAAGYITPASAIAHYGAQIATDRVSESYQDRYVTRDEDNAPRIGDGESLGGGSYRLYVSVTSHAHYKGAVYKTFTVTKKDVSAFITMLVDGSARTDGSSAVYRPDDPFILSADSGNYGIPVPFLLDGAETQSVANVRYSGKEVIPYTFAVTVDPANDDYVGEASISFTVKELMSSDPNDLVANVIWDNAAQKFTEEVLFMGVLLSPQAVIPEDLTNGYVIRYYKQDDTVNEVNEFIAGENYYYVIDVKVPNYFPAQKDGNAVAN